MALVSLGFKEMFNQKKYIILILFVLISGMVIAQNNLLIGVKIAPVFTKATITENNNGFATPIVPGYSMGIPVAYRFKEKHTITLSLNYTEKYVSIKNSAPLDTSGFLRSTDAFNTKEIQFFYTYILKHSLKNNYYIGGGGSLDFASLWKLDKSPNNNVDSYGIVANGNDYETRTYVSLMGTLGYERKLKNNRKLNIGLSYVQGLRPIQRFHIKKYGQAEETTYITKGSYLGLNVQYYFADLLKLKKSKNLESAK